MTAGAPRRVLVVDDSLVFRRQIAEILESAPGLEVSTAASGKIALSKLDLFEPDLVTLDVEMPEMDGLATLMAMRQRRPDLPVLMCSSLTERGAAVTLDALALGAADYLAKPTSGQLEAFRSGLLQKVRALMPSPREPEAAAPAPLRANPWGSPAAAAGNRAVEVVALAASTGGPAALPTLLDALPRDFPPLIIVQHMPPLFTKMLAERLGRSGALAVKEAVDGDRLERGHAYVAPGDRHLLVQGPLARATLVTSDGPHENSCRPAADVLFRSVAALYGPAALAVVLTGMGMDGLAGGERIRGAGGRVVVQDQASSLVWGMPGQLARAGLADAILPLDQIGPRLVSLTRPRPVTLTARGGRPA
jgi:two-component system chemotaxis response regulator CheB